MIQFLNDSGFVGWLIVITGIVTLGLIFERSYILYFKYNINMDLLWNQILNAIQLNKGEDALYHCSKIKNTPSGAVFYELIEKMNRDKNSLESNLENSLNENLPKFGFKIQYLSMLSNVATLLGLLGTIHGLILSFQAVAIADASAKQTLLANGISVSMYTTALGLGVAIPAMIAYSILVQKQNKMTEETIEKSGKILNLITSEKYYLQKQIIQSTIKMNEINKERITS